VQALPPINALLLTGTENVKYSRRVLEYSLRYLPSTRVTNYSDSTVVVSSCSIVHSGKAYVMVLTTLENLEISGNLLILENSGNLKFTQGIYQMLAVFSLHNQKHTIR